MRQAFRNSLARGGVRPWRAVEGADDESRHGQGRCQRPPAAGAQPRAADAGAGPGGRRAPLHDAGPARLAATEPDDQPAEAEATARALIALAFPSAPV